MPANLDDLEALLVCGDWLLDRGHPRGALIALQLGAERSGGGTFEADIFELVTTEKKRLLGPQLAAAMPSRQASWNTFLEVVFRRGFADSISLHDPVPNSGALLALQSMGENPNFVYLRSLCLVPGELDPVLAFICEKTGDVQVSAPPVGSGLPRLWPLETLLLGGELGTESIEHLRWLALRLCEIDLRRVRMDKHDLKHLEAYAEDFSMLKRLVLNARYGAEKLRALRRHCPNLVFIQ
ncbi:MAG: hypothetical protein JRH20_05490 [Deltaproteobacteria bacterium]|nr:hypothetical protein [Deltaproteobacteria bacterium]